MDLLYKRYASPFDLLERVLFSGDFTEFIKGFFEEIENEKTWDFYLHKVFDMSFSDFKNELKTESVQISESDIEATVKESMKIANACEWEVSDNGFI